MRNEIWYFPLNVQRSIYNSFFVMRVIVGKSAKLILHYICFLNQMYQKYLNSIFDINKTLKICAITTDIYICIIVIWAKIFSQSTMVSIWTSQKVKYRIWLNIENPFKNKKICNLDNVPNACKISKHDLIA